MGGRTTGVNTSMFVCVNVIPKQSKLGSDTRISVCCLCLFWLASQSDSALLRQCNRTCVCGRRLYHHRLPRTPCFEIRFACLVLSSDTSSIVFRIPDLHKKETTDCLLSAARYLKWPRLGTVKLMILERAALTLKHADRPSARGDALSLQPKEPRGPGY